MPFLIYVLDFTNMDAQREQAHDAHREYLRSIGNKLLASGALLDDDGKTIIGGISIIDTEDRSEAEKIASDDSYEKAGIRQETLVLKWRKRWWNGAFLGAWLWGCLVELYSRLQVSRETLLRTIRVEILITNQTFCFTFF